MSSLPPGDALRPATSQPERFSTSAWIFATWLPPRRKKGRAGWVSEVFRTGSWFASCSHNLLEDRRQTSNNHNTCFQTTSVFRLRWDEKVGIGLRSKMFFGSDLFSYNNSLVVMVEYTERVNIYVPFLSFCPVLLILFLMYKRLWLCFRCWDASRCSSCGWIKEIASEHFSHWRFVSLKLLRFHFFSFIFWKQKGIEHKAGREKSTF